MKKSNIARVISIGLLSGFALGASAKEAPVGAISYVQGNVSVSGNGFVAKAEGGTPLVNGAVVVVSSNGLAKVKLNGGCTVTLNGGQHLAIDSNLSCNELQASVGQMFSPYRVAQAGITGGIGAGGGAGGSLAIVGGMAAVSVVGFAGVKNDEKASGS